MNRKASAALLVAALVAPALEALGQIPITSGSLSYSQDFNTLTRSTTAESWTDNIATVSTNDAPQVVGLFGWYAGNFGTTTVAPLIRASNGGNSTGSIYSYGITSDPDRALGTLPQDAVASGSMRLGARFVNNTGDGLSGFSFSFDGEQWRRSSVTAINNQYAVYYGIFAAGTGTLDAPSTYVSVPSAYFNTPFDGDGSASASLNGNLTENRVAGLGDTVTGLSIANGEEVWIRWWDSNSSSLDHGIAIDNFSITFVIPEPSSAALLTLGFAFLAYLARRR